MTNKILIIKSREASPSGVAEKFISQGYKVDWADDLALARRLLEATEHCAVVIDRQLTETSNADGIEILSYLRNRFSGARVIVLESAAANKKPAPDFSPLPDSIQRPVPASQSLVTLHRRLFGSSRPYCETFKYV